MKELGGYTLRELTVEHLTHFDLYSSLRPKPEAANSGRRPLRRGPPSRLFARPPQYIEYLHEGAHSLVQIAFLKGMLPFAANENPWAETLVTATGILALRVLEHNSHPIYADFRAAAEKAAGSRASNENFILLLAHLLTPEAKRTADHADEARARIWHAVESIKLLSELALRKGMDISLIVKVDGKNERRKIVEGSHIPRRMEECKVTVRQDPWRLCDVSIPSHKTYRIGERKWRRNILPPPQSGFKLFEGVPESVMDNFYHSIAAPFLTQIHSLQLSGQRGNLSDKVSKLLDMKISALLPGVELPSVNGDIQETFQAANERYLGYRRPVRGDREKTLRWLRPAR